MAVLERVFGERIGSILGEFTGKIRQINQKYAKPSITLSRGAKFAFLTLQIYLIFLVALLAYKFWTIITGSA